jgi:hypothetical protein
MWQRHNAQLPNFDVPSCVLELALEPQERDLAVYFSLSGMELNSAVKKRFDLCDFASRLSARSGGRDDLT